MGKYLLLIAGAIVVYWLVRSSLRRRARGAPGTPPSEASTEVMVRCALCGIHVPRGESLVVRDRYFCCADHQQRHDAGG